MNILPIVYEQMLINSSKLQQLNISETLIATLKISSMVFPKVKAYNTGICILCSENFNYILSLPSEYEINFKSLDLKFNLCDNLYLTFFNCLVSSTHYAYISSKTHVQSVLDSYFHYMQFINSVENLYDVYLQNNSTYEIVSDKYHVFVLESCFVHCETQSNNILTIDIEA